jgi:hypothetical protein
MWETRIGGNRVQANEGYNIWFESPDNNYHFVETAH